jgi:hypothetical protein
MAANVLVRATEKMDQLADRIRTEIRHRRLRIAKSQA